MYKIIQNIDLPFFYNRVYFCCLEYFEYFVRKNIHFRKGIEMEEKMMTREDEKKKRDYSAIVQTQQFQQLLREKKRFILPFTLFFLVFYFALPIMTSYTSVLNNRFYGYITWAWVFAFAQFIMTWALCMIYSKKAVRFDHLSNEVLKEGGKQ